MDDIVDLFSTLAAILVILEDLNLRNLITNAIIYYNTLLLSRVYEQKLAAGDQDAIAVLKGVSPVAWQHVNLIGKIEFSTSASKVDIDALAASYGDPALWNKVLRKEPGEN